jgi:hypothetical protein
MAPVAACRRGNLGVEGKTSSVFLLPEGRRVKGHDVLTRGDWPWHDSAQLPGVRYARLTAMAAPRLLRAWRRRSWIEQNFRTLKHLLAMETCQGPTEGAYFGHGVLRLLASLVLMYTTRVLFKGHVTMEDMLFTLKTVLVVP